MTSQLLGDSMSQCRQREKNVPVNDEELCKECAALTEHARTLIEADELPKFSAHEFRMTAGRSHDKDRTCALCSQPIQDKEHCIIPNVQMPRRQWRGDLHFHDVCHGIWEEQGTVE